MKKKLFDHIEDKIREAAENTQPDFDEQDWVKMEALLDKEKDKKRPVLFWFTALLLILIIGFTGYKLISKTANKQEIALTELKSDKANEIKTTESQEKNTAIKKNIAVNVSTTYQLKPVENIMPAGMKRPVSKELVARGGNEMVDNNHPGKEPVTSANAASANKKKKLYKKSDKLMGIHITPASATETESEDQDKGIPVLQLSNANVKESAVVENATNPVSVTDSISKNESIKPAVEKISSVLNDTTPALVKNKERKKSFVSKFYLLGAAGPEISNTRLLHFRNSRINLRYGASLGYQVNDRWGIQAGFFVGSKKYKAGPDDYKPKDGSYWNTVTIQDVQANCLVYELPVSFIYHFKQRKSSAFFVGAGVSSYIMKKENYAFSYTRGGYAYNADWTYTGNKHLFSVASLSAGIERYFSPVFSALAESYISIPVKGVGDGNVRLFSSGINMSLKYHLFNKHR